LSRRRRLSSFLALVVLTLGTGLGIGLFEAPSGQPSRSLTSSAAGDLLTTALGSPTTSTPPLVPPVKPARSPEAPLCRWVQLSAAPTDYETGNTLLVIVFFLADRSSSACSIPAEVRLRLYDIHGNSAASLLPSAGVAGGRGFFRLKPRYGNRAMIFSPVENWCGAPHVPTAASILVTSGTRLVVPLLAGLIGPGISCVDPSARLLIESPAQVQLFPSNQTMTVPFVIGEQQKGAQLTMRIVGLRTTVRLAPSTSVPAGVVMAVRPNQGAAVALGASVHLTVSNGQ
jgi:hypothetical protein